MVVQIQPFIRNTRDYLLSDTQGRTLQKIHWPPPGEVRRGGILETMVSLFAQRRPPKSLAGGYLQRADASKTL